MMNGDEKLSSNGPTSATCNDLKFYMNSIELYLTLNARFYAKNSTKYAMRCETFLQNEYSKLFPTQQQQCHLNLANKLIYLSQTEFHQIVLWSCEFKELQQTKSLLSSSSPLAHFDTGINQINELLGILSLKIQSAK